MINLLILDLERLRKGENIKKNYLLKL